MTLVELSLVLTIVAILFAGGMGFFISQQNQDRINLTKQNIELLQQGLTIFLSQHGRLPCPASPDQSIYNPTFALEKTSLSTGILTCNVTAHLLSNSVSNDPQYYGAIPTRTLGLPDEVMLDGWGNRIGYIVTQAFVNNHLTNASCVLGADALDDHSSTQYFCYRGQASGSTNNSTTDLRVQNLMGTTISDDAVYILISHGENGYGAFRGSADTDIDATGTASSNTIRNIPPPLTNSGELRNLDCNVSTGACNNGILNVSYVQNYPTQYFDDMVVFKTRNNLLLECNMFSNNTCSNTFGIINK